jgi:DNA-binding NtrC family response regulator
VVAATHRDLRRSEVFRADLLARLAGFEHRLPSLRDRREDIGHLIAQILSKAPKRSAGAVSIAPSAGLALLRHDWPMNIRELKQALSTALVLATDGSIRPAHLPAGVRLVTQARSEPPVAVAPESQTETLEDEELRLRAVLVARMSEHRGNIAAVARAFGKMPTQVRRWLERFGLDATSFRK